MWRLTLSKAARVKPLKGLAPSMQIAAQQYATTAPAPEKIEVFVDDKSLLVDPGITVLQVRSVSSNIL